MTQDKTTPPGSPEPPDPLFQLCVAGDLSARAYRGMIGTRVDCLPASEVITRVATS